MIVFVLEGRKHDAGMLRDSQLLQSLQMFGFNPHGQPMCIYGDPAYPLRVHLQAPFRNAVLTPQMQAYNKAMSDVRTSVEWLFGDIINYFKFLDFKIKSENWVKQCGENVCCLCPSEECPNLPLWQPNVGIFSTRSPQFARLLCIKSKHLLQSSRDFLMSSLRILQVHTTLVLSKS